MLKNLLCIAYKILHALGKHLSCGIGSAVTGSAVTGGI
jgi:hypothetical protein